MKVICNKCKKVRGLSKENAEKIIKKFGSEEKAQAEYLCRTCNKETKIESKEKLKEVK